MNKTTKTRFSVALAAVFALIGAAYTLNLPAGEPVQAQKMKQGESVKDVSRRCMQKAF